MKPEVSVIIPTFNRAAFLKSAIKSALHQTYDDIEIIVVDDNSSAPVHDVIKKLQDTRIKYIRHKHNFGVSVARNTGIKASKGKYIAFLDDDDEWLPEKLEKQVEIIKKSSEKVCGIYSNFFIIDNFKKKTTDINPKIKVKRGNLFKQFALGNPIHTSTVFIKKKCIKEIGLFDETISYMEDRDLWIRLAAKWDFEYIDQPLIKILVHQKPKLSENIENQIKGRKKIIERYDYLFKKYKKAHSKLYLLQGAQYCQIKNMKEGRKNLINGIKIYPFNYNAYVHYILSLLGANVYQRVRSAFGVK